MAKEKDQVEVLAEQTATNIRLKFNEYAIEKYGVDNLALRKFYEKYDKAVDFYSQKSHTKAAWNKLSVALLGVGASGMIAAASTGSFQEPTGLIIAGVGMLGAITLHVCLNNFNVEVEYRASKKNPYITKGSIEDKMAQDYSAYKVLYNRMA